MKTKLINSQLSNYKTYLMYQRQLLTLAENVFQFKNLPVYLDVSYLNSCLLRQGAVAFFYDDVMEKILALPFMNIGTLDVYGRPKTIRVYSQNGYQRTLKQDEFVIMYDNNGRYPIFLDILQYSERIANNIRTSDINVKHQRTPRFWKTSVDKERSVKDIVNNVDALAETVITYQDINIDDTSLVLSPAPFVTDKIMEYNDKLWSEFFRLIGVANVTEVKKERMIRDEMVASQGGTIASRFSRFEPRSRALKEINEKFKDYLEKPIEVEYYDGEPSDVENRMKNEEKEEDENVESISLSTDISENPER